MSQEVNKGLLIQPNLRGGGFGLAGGGYATWLKVGQIARTNVSTFNLVNTVDPLATKPVLFLPVGALVVSIGVSTPVASNAGTTATISVGISGGSGTYFINALSVLTGSVAPNAQVWPVVTNLFVATGGSTSAPLNVTGIYAETGTASTTGGPWNIAIEYVIP